MSSIRNVSTKYDCLISSGGRHLLEMCPLNMIAVFRMPSLSRSNQHIFFTEQYIFLSTQEMGSSFSIWSDNFIDYMIHSIEGRSIENWKAYMIAFPPPERDTRAGMAKIQLYFPEKYVADIFRLPPVNANFSAVDACLESHVYMLHGSLYGAVSMLGRFINRYPKHLREEVFHSLRLTFDLSKVYSIIPNRALKLLTRNGPFISQSGKPAALIDYTDTGDLFMNLIVIELINHFKSELFQEATINLELTSRNMSVPATSTLRYSEEYGLRREAGHDFGPILFANGVVSDAEKGPFLINGTLKFSIPSENITWTVTELKLTDHIKAAVMHKGKIYIDGNPVGPDLNPLIDNANTETDTRSRKIFAPEPIKNLVTVNNRVVDDIYGMLGVMEGHDAIKEIRSNLMLEEDENGYYYDLKFFHKFDTKYMVNPERTFKELYECDWIKLSDVLYLVVYHDTTHLALSFRLYIGMESLVVCGGKVFDFKVPAFHILSNLEIFSKIVMSTLIQQKNFDVDSNILLYRDATIATNYLESAKYFEIILRSK